jgi:predicted Holliday junction resolvase-like endonuclease
MTRMPITTAILSIAAAAAIGALIMWIRMRLRWSSLLAAARKQSVNQSRATLKGQIGEQLAPLLPGFQYEASDARFLGDPIDYVIFHGYTSLRDSQAGAPTEVEVIILDIKRGGAKLSPSQRAVADAVQAGRVRFEVVRVADDGAVDTRQYASRRQTS